MTSNPWDKAELETAVTNVLNCHYPMKCERHSNPCCACQQHSFQSVSINEHIARHVVEIVVEVQARQADQNKIRDQLKAQMRYTALDMAHKPVLRAAVDLVSGMDSPAENPEYVRALSEIICTVFGFDTDHKDLVAQNLILMARDDRE